MFRLPLTWSGRGASSSTSERDPLEASDGEFFSHEGKNESVVFLPHVLRGLGFSVSDFFRGLLHH